MTLPETCGETGGAVSLWINITECAQFDGIVTTANGPTTGFYIVCVDSPGIG